MHEIAASPLPPLELFNITGNRLDPEWHVSQSPLSIVFRWTSWRSSPHDCPSTFEVYGLDRKSPWHALQFVASRLTEYRSYASTPGAQTAEAAIARKQNNTIQNL